MSCTQDTPAILVEGSLTLHPAGSISAEVSGRAKTREDEKSRFISSTTGSPIKTSVFSSKESTHRLETSSRRAMPISHHRRSATSSALLSPQTHAELLRCTERSPKHSGYINIHGVNKYSKKGDTIGVCHDSSGWKEYKATSGVCRSSGIESTSGRSQE